MRYQQKFPSMYTTLTTVIGLFQEKTNKGGGELMMEWNFQGLIKNNMQFSGVIKKDKIRNQGNQGT